MRIVWCSVFVQAKPFIKVVFAIAINENSAPVE